MKLAIQIFGLLIFGSLALWDVTTTVLGVASAAGTVKVVAGSPGQIFLDLFFSSMSTANIIVLALAVFITCFDLFFHQALKNREKDKNKFYATAFIFAIFKSYDIYTTFLGTARVILPGLDSYPKQIGRAHV